MQGRVRPEVLEEYRHRHRAVWPELLRALAAAGWRDYALFLGEDGMLVGFVEAEDLASAQAAVAATDVNERWQSEMSRFFVGLDGRAPDTAWRLLEPIFELNEQLAALRSPAPQRLRVEDHPVSPLKRGRALPAALTGEPRLSWVLPVVRQGQRQTAYQVVAAQSSVDPRSAPPGLLMLDTGRIESEKNAHLRWPGEPLAAHTRLSWAVRTWDETGSVSEWSDLVDLVVGPPRLTDWTARWISVPPTQAARVGFITPGLPTRAVLHLAGHGLLRAFINGRVVNPDASDPSRTALSRAAARSYDVTHLLTSGGEQAIAIVATLGHYRMALVSARLLAELVLDFSDGTTQRIGTGEHWHYAGTSVIADDPYYLECHDNRVDDGWAHPGNDDSWSPALLADGPDVVAPDAGPPVCVVEEIEATAIPGGHSNRDGASLVFDVGVNVAGRARIAVSGVAPGIELRIVHGEKLDGRGQVDTRNIRLPDDADRERQVLSWICAGESEVIEPWFAVYGFRYVEVHGLPPGARASVTARVLHSDLAQTGSFSSDDPLLDRMVDMALRTQRNNTHSHPEDCPTREQGGWTGDASVSAEAAFAHLDMAGVYRHWLGDVMADQRADGGILGVTPHLMGEDHVQPPDPVWGAAMTEIPLRHWRSVGDLSLVQDTLPAMRRWLEWQLSTLEGGVVRHADISYGADWLAPEQTPPVLLQTAAVVRALRALAELEEAAGDPATATMRSEQAASLVESARAILRDPVTGQWANGSQASLATALTSGLVAPDEADELRGRLATDVHRRGDRLASGFAGTQSVIRAMSAIDGGAGLLRAVHQPEQPGIGSMLVDGPGTFWETWWIDHGNVGVASLDHIGLAAPFAAWAWQTVAGLEPLAPGYRRFALAPRLLGPIGRCAVKLETVRGTIDFAWSVEAGNTAGNLDLTADLTVPVGAVGVLDLVGMRSENVEVDGEPAAGHGHVTVTDAGLEFVTGTYQVFARGVRRTGTTASIGAVADVSPGSSVRVPVFADPSMRAEIGADWSAVRIGDDLVVTASAGVPVGSTTIVRLVNHDSTVAAAQTVRAGISGQWLSDGRWTDGWLPDDGVAFVRIDGSFVCSPVFHGPIPGPILEVTLAGLHPDELRWLRLPLATPQDLTAASMVYAEFDLCAPYLPGRTLTPHLRLTSLDGITVTGITRVLPISWNRVSVEVSGWAGAKAVSEIAVALRWQDVHDPARGSRFTAGEQTSADAVFRVGRVGWTSAPRTW